MHDDIEEYVKKCKHCNHTAAKPIKEPLHPWPDSKKPWSRLHIDFAGPIHGQWILVIVDSYSKFVDAGWFSTITSAATCRYLRRLFSRYGPPEVLVSDNSTQFTSEEFAQLCAEFNILHLRSPPGHPQSNGQAERMVRTLKSSIETSSASQLESKSNRFLYAYNYTPSDVVPDHKSSAEVFFGRKFRTPLDIFTPIAKPTTDLTPQQEKMKQQFDDHHGAKPRSFIPGQSVVIQLSNEQRISGKIVKLIDKTIARVNFEGGFIKRLAVNSRHWPAQPNSTPNTSQVEPEEAEPPSNEVEPLEPPEPPSNEVTQVPGPTVRRSEHLSRQLQPDYKTVGRTRQYRQKHS
ncbi:uncharacterized protein K02A2.6-like [Formica exsecta]|uniref:uncharacterized protein K02A2.6-like n=1 Tax=Formica exsecta TaxID=72781 RepID=UPI001144622E|nr:uncharacterized protein K02A2.6-like [Formica exsecta]